MIWCKLLLRGVTLPADGVGGKITGDDEEAVTLEVCSSVNRSVDAEQVKQSRNRIKRFKAFIQAMKEFKLNPAANMVYVPNSSPPVPLATIQPEVGFNQHFCFSKFSQNDNLTVGGSQFSQPLQYAAHYTPVLSKPAYSHPTSSPAVMVGRSTQLVYVQQVSHIR